jgi:hypothetical protein
MLLHFWFRVSEFALMLRVYTDMDFGGGSGRLRVDGLLAKNLQSV